MFVGLLTSSHRLGIIADNLILGGMTNLRAGKSDIYLDRTLNSEISLKNASIFNLI